MKVILQIGVVFGVCLIGEAAACFLPFPFPASVLSMILLFLLLCLKVLKIDHIRQKADFLLQNMAFFFIPAGVGILEQFEFVKDSMWQLLLICLVTTLLTFGVTARGALRRMAAKEIDRQGGLVMEAVTSSPLFGIVLSILAYAVGVWLNRKAKNAVGQPAACSDYFSSPGIAGVPYPLGALPGRRGFYRPVPGSRYRLSGLVRLPAAGNPEKNLFPVLLGCAAGSLTSMLSVYGLCRAFRLDEKLTASMLPKSVTTPIAMEISRQHGGIVPVTVAAVIITGILGSMLAPLLIKAFRVKIR